MLIWEGLWNFLRFAFYFYLVAFALWLAFRTFDRWARWLTYWHRVGVVYGLSVKSIHDEGREVDRFMSGLLWHEAKRRVKEKYPPTTEYDV